MRLLVVGIFAHHPTTEWWIVEALRDSGHSVAVCDYEKAKSVHHIVRRTKGHDAVLCINQLWSKKNERRRTQILTAKSFAPCFLWTFDKLYGPHFDDRYEWFCWAWPKFQHVFVSDPDVSQWDEVSILREAFPHRDAFELERVEPVFDIAFFGSLYARRFEWWHALNEAFPQRCAHFNGLHGQRMNWVCQRSKVVVAPDWPASPGYWSARHYLALGYGSFYLAPDTGQGEEGFEDGVHYVSYHGWRDLKHKLRYWLDPKRAEQRRIIAEAGRRFVLERHTFLNRAETLSRTIWRELGRARYQEASRAIHRTQQALRPPRIASIVRTIPMGISTVARGFGDYVGYRKTLSLSLGRPEDGDYPFWYTHPAYRRAENRHLKIGPGPSHAQAGDLISDDDVHWLLDGVDALLVWETTYRGDILPLAGQRGIRVYHVPNHEFLWTWHPHYEHVTRFLCYSMLEFEACREFPRCQLSCPVDTARIPFRLRSRARVFVHNAGHGGFGRNQTQAIVDAWRLLRSPARLLLRSIYRENVPAGAWDLPQIKVEVGAPADYWRLWDEGDVLLFPTAYSGAALPMREAMAAGMPPVVSRLWPHCGDVAGRPGELPERLQELAFDTTLRPIMRIGEVQQAALQREVTAAIVSPEAIAERVDALYDARIAELSKTCRAWSGERSWERVAGEWVKAMQA